jgi:hypothetical protein
LRSIAGEQDALSIGRDGLDLCQYIQAAHIVWAQIHQGNGNRLLAEAVERFLAGLSRQKGSP